MTKIYRTTLFNIKFSCNLLRKDDVLGRGGNTWLSPKGCAMFSTQLHIPLNSHLGKYPSMLQHITSLAIVASICQIPGLEVGIDLLVISLFSFCHIIIQEYGY